MIEPVAKQNRKLSYYIFEKIPGVIFFALIIFFLIGGLVAPEATAYAIIILNVFFLYKSGMLAATFFLAFLKIRQSESVEWRERIIALEDRDTALQTIEKNIEELKKKSPNGHMLHKNKFLNKLLYRLEKYKSLRFLEREYKQISNVQIYSDWRSLQHIVIIPHVKEPEHILRATLENLRNQKFPKEQLNIVLASEARDPDGLPMSQRLAAEYSQHFNNIWVSNHILTDEEVVGKSSNMKAAGKVAYAKVLELGWDLKKTLITSCDADSKLPDEYFAYVSYKFATREDAEYKIYNGALVFHNNIWRLPFYARVKNSMSTIYNVSRLIRTDKLIPFSTYTTSFWLIKEIGFWTPWVTPEDFHLFFKAQFKFGSLVSTVPIFLRIQSDAAEGKGHLDTIRNNYNQERRWSWGISDDGWVLQNLFHGIGKYDFVVFYRGLHSVFDHVISPVMGLMLVAGGNIPTLINPTFNTTVLGAQLPYISSTIITLSLGFMIIVIITDFLFKPRREGRRIIGIILSAIEWLFLPIASFVLAVLPGLEANTRILFGRYLEYYVTKKH